MRAARTISLALLMACLLAGCATPAPRCVGDGTNLIFARSRQETNLATQFAVRSSWPYVEGGYVFDDITYFSTYTYDRQSFYDRLGGELDRQAETVRTSVFLR